MSHLYEAFHLQSILCTLGNPSFQHTYEENNVLISILQIGKLKETSHAQA